MDNSSPSLVAQFGEVFTYKQEWLEDWERYYCEPSYLSEFTINRPCILVGSRGSGKTTTLKCLTYESTRRIMREKASDLTTGVRLTGKSIFEKICG